MLKLNEVNPLSVFGIRWVQHCPPHFTVVDFDIRTDEKTITDWIWTNLSGRFYINTHYYQNSTKSLGMCKRVAFELPAEASYFSLLLDTINLP